jgi:hypothetical protein
MGEHMKKRVYLPSAGSSSSRRPTVSVKNRDLLTPPTVSATSVKIEKPATILPVAKAPEPQSKAPKLQSKPTAEERAEQSARDRQRVSEKRRQRILKRAPQHQPAPIGTLGPIEFDRCVCGFTLRASAVAPTGSASEVLMDMSQRSAMSASPRS